MTETQNRPDDRRVTGGVPATWTVGEKYGFTTLGERDWELTRLWVKGLCSGSALLLRYMNEYFSKLFTSFSTMGQ